MTFRSMTNLVAVMGVAALAVAGAPALAQSDSGIPSSADQPTTGTAGPVVQPQPDLHGRADTGEGQQHGSDGASPGSTGGGVTTNDPAGSGPTMNSDGAPPATGGPASPSQTNQ